MKKIAIALLFALLAGYTAVSQSPGIQDDVPEAALLTERGQELAQRLRYLRRSESNMGDRHPSLPSVREEIKQVIQQLQAWAPLTPEASGDKGAQGRPSLQMNDRDLRQLVIQMANRIEQLEARVKKLEENQLR